MKFINLKSKTEVCCITQPIVLCIGNFDGVHLGHRQLVNTVLQKQVELKKDFPNILSGAWFFDSNSYKNTNEIYSLDEKLDIFASLGLQYAIIADFNEMKSLTPEDFVNKILQDTCKCVHAVCGENFRFGVKASGDSQTLSTLMNENATVVSLLTQDNNIISSTFIRSLLASGNIEKANLLLSANYSIVETVVHGKQLGRTLGLPTINQNIKSKNLILKNGIYATICTIDNRKYYGVTNIGVRPTVDDNQFKNIETHIIDFDSDCYGKIIKVEFIHRIRDEIKFNSIDELKSQIQQDILTTKTFFSHN